jgi:hypothetical protein
MKITYSSVAAATAATLAGAALMAALTHTGPRGGQGQQGPQGPAGTPAKITQQAVTARLGVCWNSATQTAADGAQYVSSVWVNAPLYVNGVYQCLDGETFVPVTPQANPYHS